MNAQLSVISPLPLGAAQPTSTLAPFRKVKDSRGLPIRGLWKRNGRFYAQLRTPGKRSPTKVALLDAEGQPLVTVAQAREALNKLLHKRRYKSLLFVSKTPGLSEWVETYIGWLKCTGAKSPLTIAKEYSALSLWTRQFGTFRLEDLNRAHINEFVRWRKETHQVSNRTVNLDVIALNNCLKHAVQEGRLRQVPTADWQSLNHVSVRRPLWNADQIEAVCHAAKAEGENGQLLADYIRFMAYSGARRNEALNVAWDDVDWGRRLLTIRKTKYGRPRDLDFNPKLEAHLKEMQGRKVGRWLFPSPRQSGEGNEPARNLQGSLETARQGAGLPHFCFHDLRHYFISSCVMAGIDYMTIARWVGHRDGGILIGRVYGHLSDEHARRMAGKLTSL